MNKKIQRELHGPGWAEVILGVVLSLALGAALAFVHLAAKPVSVVKQLPEQPVADVVYYVEGSRQPSKTRQAVAKQRAFLEGKSVELTEDELNQLVTPASPSAGNKSEAEKGAAVTAGTPNFRISDGVLQVAVLLSVKVAGVDRDIIVQARGGFEKRGETFVFAPNELYLGSCPLQRLPVLRGLIMDRLLSAVSLPDELADGWRQLSDVSVEGSVLRLTI